LRQGGIFTELYISFLYFIVSVFII